MYHYQKNIGDYRSATQHFTLVEHGVYNQLLDWYYLDEQALPIDNRTLFRRLSAKSEVEQEAVVVVLSEMFIQTDAGWVHKRVEREIAQYRAKANQAREAGKLGGRPSKKGHGLDENRDGYEKKPDAKPTANREPSTSEEEKALVPLAPSESFFEAFWKTYPARPGKVKVGKKPCATKWKARKLDTVAYKILANVEWQKKHNREWIEGFAPNPEVYLNQDRWEDGGELGTTGVATAHPIGASPRQVETPESRRQNKIDWINQRLNVGVITKDQAKHELESMGVGI